MGFGALTVNVRVPYKIPYKTLYCHVWVLTDKAGNVRHMSHGWVLAGCSWCMCRMLCNSQVECGAPSNGMNLEATS